MKSLKCQRALAFPQAAFFVAHPLASLKKHPLHTDAASPHECIGPVPAYAPFNILCGTGVKKIQTWPYVLAAKNTLASENSHIIC